MVTIHTRTTAAKEIKQTLKKLYPMIKFSFTSDSFANGNSIDVRWNLGPTTDKIDAIIKKYQYGHFDGMTDCYNYDDTLVLRENGDIAELGGAKFVHATRDYMTLDEIANTKIGWRRPGWRDLWQAEMTFHHIVGRDLCKAAGIEYHGLEMPVPKDVMYSRSIYSHGPNQLKDVVYQTINKVDLLDGYHGIKNKIGETGLMIKNEFVAY